MDKMQLQKIEGLASNHDDATFCVAARDAIPKLIADLKEIRFEYSESRATFIGALDELKARAEKAEKQIRAGIIGTMSPKEGGTAPKCVIITMQAYKEGVNQIHAQRARAMRVEKERDEEKARNRDLCVASGAQAAKLQKKLTESERELKELKEEFEITNSSSISICIHCGEILQDEDDKEVDHWRNCKEHPAQVVLASLDKAEKERDEARRMYCEAKFTSGITIREFNPACPVRNAKWFAIAKGWSYLYSKIEKPNEG